MTLRREPSSSGARPRTGARRGGWLIAVLLWAASWPALAGRAPGAERWTALTETVFQNYGREQGMPSVVPTALAQDGDGFVWVGTQSGLLRWDGYVFRQYDQTRGAGLGMPWGWIQVMHTDVSGRLWVGTDSAGLAVYDLDKDSFTFVRVGPAASGARHISAIADDGAGGIWVGADDGLYRLDSRNAAGPTFRHVDGDPRSLPGDHVRALLLDHLGRLWVGTDKGLARRDGGADGFTPVALGQGEHGDILVSALLEDREGRIWVGTSQRGLYRVEPGGHAAQPFVTGDSAGWTPRTARIVALAASGEHEIWAAMRTQGILAIDTATNRARRIRHDKLTPGSLAHDDVWTMMRDRAGALWVAGAGGVSYHAASLGVMSTAFGDTLRPRGITGSDISTVFSARDGRIWLGFLTGGVDIIDPAIGRIARLRPDSSHPETALPPDVTAEMTQDRAGNVYIGTPRGVYRADPAGRKVRLLRPPGRDAHANASSVLVDGDCLWVASREGLWRIPLTARAPPLRRPADFRGLGDQGVIVLLKGAGQELWIGTVNGLDRLDLDTGAIETIPVEAGDPMALPARLIASLALDRQGRLWVGTFGGGVAVMTGRDGAGRARFRRLGVSDGLPNPNIDKVLLDGAGLIWASSEDGLAVIDPVTFKVRALGRSDGAVLRDYWVKSGATDRWGEPLFGGEGGLAIGRPGWPPTSTAPPAIVVSEIRIAGVPVSGGRFDGRGSSRPLVLTAKTDRLTVEFSALDFTSPERDRYGYLLSGFDRKWNETDAGRRLAVYTNLPPGDYVLRLRAANGDGRWAASEVHIPIRVEEAWYQTGWMKIAAVLALTAVALPLAAAYERSRTARLRRRQIELERQIAERTTELEAANARLSELATTDPLTGCANRRRFMSRARELIALGGFGAPISLAIMDLDNFKQINDRHGHPCGDEVLRAVGRTCQTLMRATDLTGRIGGEEFALLMPNTTAADGLLVADRLRASLADIEVRAGDVTIRVTASLGLAQQRPGEDFDSLYARADGALYVAKQSGRNRIVLAAEPADAPVIG